MKLETKLAKVVKELNHIVQTGDLVHQRFESLSNEYRKLQERYYKVNYAYWTPAREVRR